MHSIYTRHFSNLYLSLTNLVIYQSEVQFSGMKIFSNYPFKIKVLSDNPRTFTIALKCLYKYSFYSLRITTLPVSKYWGTESL